MNDMDAFFQSAMNGTLKLKDGIIQVGEAEKKAFSGKSGFGKSYCNAPTSLRLCNNAT